MEENRTYIAIDLKSFYASVECVERGLDPLTTNLVVADASRSPKTICLAVSPSLRALGIPGRARLFEAIQKAAEINADRRRAAPGRALAGASHDATELAASPKLALGFITATPRMALYIQYSTRIYDIYLRYVAPEDIYVYSVDEVFIDVTCYLPACKLSAREMAMRMILDVLGETGITATAGIGTNLYLAKVAMDIEAKHIPADENGVRIAELNEMSYRRSLWAHRPLTDFWRVGRGYARKLEENGLFTMGDVARCSMGKPPCHHSEALLYKLFGVNAELLIDHAWGLEPCTMADIKAYKPTSSSVGSGQVLHHPYPFDKTKLIIWEMTDLLVLDLVEKGLVTDQIVLSVGYDVDNLKDPERKKNYRGGVTVDMHGRSIPKPAHGSVNLGRHTSSSRLILEAVMGLFDRVVDKNLTARRVAIAATHVVGEDAASAAPAFEQLDLFTDYEAVRAARAAQDAALERERRMQQAVLSIKRKHGRNAILRGKNLEDGATTVDRNRQIGGHRA